jgi:hypothetical protein
MRSRSAGVLRRKQLSAAAGRSRPAGAIAAGRAGPCADNAGRHGVRIILSPDFACPPTTLREQACASCCEFYMAACADVTGAYETASDCNLLCYSSVWPIGAFTLQGSIRCRCYHAFLALKEGQIPHCLDAAEEPTTGRC